MQNVTFLFLEGHGPRLFSNTDVAHVIKWKEMESHVGPT